MRLYLAGPISGIVDFNRPAFECAARVLRAQGHTVVNPFEVSPVMGDPWAEHMKRDITAMLTCTGVVRLDNWQQSQGAQLEVYIARALSMRFYCLQGGSLEELPI
jgi:hypothetical protein